MQPLQILSLALLVCLFGWLYNSCVLLPCRKEKKLFFVTLVSGVLNVALNLVLIPYFKESAAAFTTLLAELCSMVMCIHYSKGLVELMFDWKIVGSVAVGCFGILAVCTVVKALPLPLLATIFTAGVGGGLRRDPDRAEKSAGAGVSGQIQAEAQTQDLNFSAKLLPPSLT